MDSSEDVVLRWEEEQLEDTKTERIGCASSALESLSLFGRRNSARTGASLTLDVLERMINQDAPEYVGSDSNSRYSRSGGDKGVEQTKYCGLTSDGYTKLMAAINNKKLPKDICIPYDDLVRNARRDRINAGSVLGGSRRTTGKVDVPERDCHEGSYLLRCGPNLGLAYGYTSSGCKLEWIDATKTEPAHCKLSGVGCMLVDGCVQTTDSAYWDELSSANSEANCKICSGAQNCGTVKWEDGECNVSNVSTGCMYDVKKKCIGRPEYQ